MCGILFTNKDCKNIDINYVIEFLKFRGPDFTSIKKINNYTFIHTLLSMTGPITEQPFYNSDSNIICIYNGEIYNFEEFGDYKSDGECLIPLYEKYGIDFIKKLDGEFALILLDFNKNILIVSTDIFGTRPLWLGYNNNDEFGISSYKSCLERLNLNINFQILANTTYIFNIKNLNLIEEKYVHKFDLTQFKNNFDDWNKAFEKSISKRTKNVKHGIFIGLSGGYDSGSIACELTKQNINFSAYSISNVEDEKTLLDRSNIIKKSFIIKVDRYSFLDSRKFLKERCEEYKLNIDNGEKEKYFKIIDKKSENEIKKILEIIEFRKNEQILTDDNGAIGCSYICSLATKNNEKIYLSGSGADEIFSDYGFNGIKFYDHSSIGGYFPNDLNEVFPWKNFFNNTQRAYLMKEEHVAGAYGIEGRYPFLDKDVVQEFLWLCNSLKNKNYKSPLDNYLTINNFPFEKNQKTGFGCGHSGPSSKNKSYDTLSDYQIKLSRERKVTDFVENRKVDFNIYNKKSYENHDFLKIENITYKKGFLYTCKIEISDIGLKYKNKNNFILYENNIPIGKSEKDHEKIKNIGGGLYCFWTSNTLYFSTSDNTDPRYNNRIYSIDKIENNL